MKITMHARNMTIGEQLKKKIEHKLMKLDRYFGEEAEAQVTTKIEGDLKCLELTVRVQKHIYRAESKEADIFTALDGAVSNLERQIRKQKSKIEKRIRDYAYMKEALREEGQYVSNEPEETEIVHRKQFELEPMTAEEACMQMELMGHQFYLFLRGDSGKVGLVYKRKDGNYGLIEPLY